MNYRLLTALWLVKYHSVIGHFLGLNTDPAKQTFKQKPA